MIISILGAVALLGTGYGIAMKFTHEKQFWSPMRAAQLLFAAIFTAVAWFAPSDAIRVGALIFLLLDLGEIAYGVTGVLVRVLARLIDRIHIDELINGPVAWSPARILRNGSYLQFGHATPPRGFEWTNEQTYRHCDQRFAAEIAAGDMEPLPPLRLLSRCGN
jgi:hypothetical protein